MLVTLIALIATGGLLCAVSIPLMQKRVAPNRWLGFRTPRTLEDPELWYTVNAYAGKWLFGMGVLVLTTSILLYLVPNMNEDLYGGLMSFIVLATVLFGLFQSYRYQQHIVEEQNKS